MSEGAGAAGDAAAFELERFECIDGRIELRGRWSGVRGMRFMRPTLTLSGSAGQQRLLAVLDHKPWEPGDGDEWVAAFAWEGDSDAFDEAELSVAPGVEVLLPAPAAPGRKPRRKRGQVFEARESQPPAASSSPTPVTPPAAADEPAATEPSRLMERPADEMAARRAEVDGLEEQIDRLKAELRNAGSRAELEAAAREDVERQRDEALAEREAAISERDAAVAARDVAEAERELVRRELAAAAEVVARATDASGVEREAGGRELEAAEREREAAERQRDAIAAERDAALRERSALESAAARRAWRDPRRPQPRAVSDWTSRLIALGIFLAFALVVLLLFHGDL